MTRKKSRDARTAEIIEATVTELLGSGYEGASMEAIAQRAGLTKGGLYHHFAGKDELLRAANRRFFEPVARLMQVAQEDGDAVRGLKRFIRGYVAHWAEHPRELAFTFLSISRLLGAPDIWPSMDAYVNKVLGFYRDMLARAAPRLGLGPGEVESRALSMMAALDGITGYVAMGRWVSRSRAAAHLERVLLPELERVRPVRRGQARRIDMTRIKRLVLFVLGGFFVLVAGVAVLLASAFMGRASMVDGRRLPGLEVVRCGHVSAYVLDIGAREVALVDTGDDAHAGAILSALQRRGLGPDAVKAVLLTHGDDDHIAGVPVFPGATVMALAPEVALVEGRTTRAPLRRPKPTGIRVDRALHDGEVIALGAGRVEVFAVPGHTPGSAAFLVRGTLLLGDSADTTDGGGLVPSSWLFCADRPRNRRSLRHLAERLGPRSAEVEALACSHSGVLTRGLAPLVELATPLGR